MLAAKVEREMRSKRALGSPEDFFIIIICLFVYLFKSRNTWGFIYFINIY